MSIATADEGIVPVVARGVKGSSALSYQLNLACVAEGIERQDPPPTVRMACPS